MFYQAPTFTDDSAELIARFKADGGQITRKERRGKARPAMKETFINERIRSF